MWQARKGKVSVLALSPSAALHRFSFVLVFMAALFMLFISAVKPDMAERVRTQAVDVFSPLMAMVTEPVSKFSKAVADISSITELRAENERLKAENDRLRQYQTAALQLEAENKGLRDLLKLPVVPEQRRIVASVIADAGGPYTRNIIVQAGSAAGIRSGLVAMDRGGLVGRVVSVGNNSSRVLLVSDINARVPVLVERTRQRALVAGDNDADLLLKDFSPNTRLIVGDRLITSGVGGIYPPDLPVGVVSKIDGTVVTVEPLADLGRLELVQLLDAGTPADLLTPESTQSLPSGMRPAMLPPPATASGAAP